MGDFGTKMLTVSPVIIWRRSDRVQTWRASPRPVCDRLHQFQSWSPFHFCNILRRLVPLQLIRTRKSPPMEQVEILLKTVLLLSTRRCSISRRDAMRREQIISARARASIILKPLISEWDYWQVESISRPIFRIMSECLSVYCGRTPRKTRWVCSSRWSAPGLTGSKQKCYDKKPG